MYERKTSEKYSSPPQLRYPPSTLFLQLRYFELGPKKLELSYFLLFSSSYAIFSFFGLNSWYEYEAPAW